MRKQKILLRILVVILVLIGVISCTKVPPGHVGVKVYLLGQKKGVNTEELGVGRYWVGVNQELYLFPTFQQNYVWTKDKKEGSPNDESFTFQTKEGLEVNADVGITYHLNPEKITDIFEKYRKGIDEITDIFMRNSVRDAFNSVASTYNVESVYGSGKTKLINTVQSKIKDELTEQGIIVDKLYWIGALRLPKTVVTALNEKIEATQDAMKIENELRKAEAQAKITITEAQASAEVELTKAKAQAEANHIKARSISSILIEYQKTLNAEKAIEKWDGKLPNATSGMPFFELDTK